jgi:hypothetical protein
MRASRWLASLWLASAGCSIEEPVSIHGPDGGSDAADTTPWAPPIDALGEPGWKASTTPWCHDLRGPDHGFDVWSDERGVFVLVSQMPDYYTTTLNRVYLNDGTGWTLYVDETSPESSPEDGIWHMSGAPGGAIFGYGVYGEVTRIERGTLTGERFWARDLWIVDDRLAYAAGTGDDTVAVWNGATWGPLPGEPLSMDSTVVWADGESLFVGGTRGMMVTHEDGSWIVHDTRTVDDFSAIWGFAGDDVWAGTYEGSLLHYDGASWSHVDWPNMGDSPDPTSCRSTYQQIRGMWGTGGTLFVFTASQLLVWDGAEFSTIAYWPGTDGGEGESHTCDGRAIIDAVWGDSETDLYLAVRADEERARGICFDHYLLYWDGSEFHLF